MKGIFGIFLSIFLMSQVLAAPPQQYSRDIRENEIEEDHELIGDFFEGDMELEMTRNGLIAETKRWPNRNVPYKIDEVFDEDHKRHILRALRMIEAVSCIRFYPAPNDLEQYVHVIGEPSGCHSKVGYQGKYQTLNLQVDPLDKGCFKLGSIVHEFLHALGFHHQQSAWNRDDYVLIVEENIKDGIENNFKKYDDGVVSDFGTEYDYNSIMHYSSTAFSKNGEKTIVPLADENIGIGQRRMLSNSDIAKLNLMYRCPMQN